MTTDAMSDERTAFEAWAATKHDYQLMRNLEGRYREPYTQEAWIGWQAGLAARPQGEPPPTPRQCVPDERKRGGGLLDEIVTRLESAAAETDCFNVCEALALARDMRGKRDRLVERRGAARAEVGVLTDAEDSSPLGWSLRKTDEHGGKYVICYWVVGGWNMEPIYRLNGDERTE